jgi:hypothetical protein
MPKRLTLLRRKLGHRLESSLGSLPYLQHRVKLRRLQASIRRIRAAYDRDYDAAKKAGKSHDDLHNIEWDKHTEIDYTREGLYALETGHLMEQAERYGVPRPVFDTRDKAIWVEGQHTGKIYLTPHGLADLRSAIRKEQKERREMWLPVAALVITVLSLLVALASVLRK